MNAGQVGSMRAAKYIALRRKDMPGEARDLPKECLEQIAEMLLLGERTLNNTGHGTKRVQDAYAETTERMSRTGGAIRKEADMKTALTDVSADLAGLADGVGISTRDELCLLFRLRDTLIAQKMYLTAMVDYCKTIGLSRGSSLYSDLNGKRPVGDLSEMFCHRLDDASQRNRIQIVTMKQENCECCWRDARPIPDVDNFFENVWRDFRETQGVDN